MARGAYYTQSNPVFPSLPFPLFLSFPIPSLPSPPPSSSLSPSPLHFPPFFHPLPLISYIPLRHIPLLPSLRAINLPLPFQRPPISLLPRWEIAPPTLEKLKREPAQI